MVVPMGKRTCVLLKIARHFLFLHLYLRLQGTKVFSTVALCTQPKVWKSTACPQSFLISHTVVWEKGVVLGFTFIFYFHVFDKRMVGLIRASFPPVRFLPQACDLLEFQQCREPPPSETSKTLFDHPHRWLSQHGSQPYGVSVLFLCPVDVVENTPHCTFSSCPTTPGFYY